MGKFVLKNAKILLDKYDLSGELNEVTLNLTKGEVDITVFGDSALRRTGGLKSLDVSWSGFFEANAAGTGSDNIMFSSLSSADQILTVIPEGSTVGDPCYFTKVTAFEYSTGGTVGDAMSFTGSAMSSDGEPIVRGYLLGSETYASSGADNGTEVLISAVRANDTMYGVYHCTAASVGDSCGVKIQSDTTGFGSPLDVVTFTGITGTTTKAELSTDTDTDTQTYWRVVVTPVGASVSYTIHTIAGIIPNEHYPQVTE